MGNIGTIKILVVGLGGAGQRHLRILKHLLPEAEFYLLRSLQKTPVLNENFEVIPGNLSEIFNAKELYNINSAVEINPELVIISSPTSLHIKHAEPFVDIAQLILIEKPLTFSKEEAETFINKVNNSKTQCFISYQRRFLKCWQEAKKIIEAGCLGEIKYCNIHVNSFLPEWHSWEDFKQLYAARKDLGGGVVLTECHELDIIQWLFGTIECISAMGGNWSYESLPVEDCCSMLLGVKVNQRTHLRPFSVTLDFMSRHYSRTMYVEFQRGNLIVDAQENSLTIRDYFNEGKNNIQKFEQEDPFILQGKEILRVFQNTKQSVVLATLDDGLKNVSVIDAIKTSFSIPLTYDSLNSLNLPEESLPVIEAVITMAKEVFGEDLIALYGMGSLGYGGFVPGWSDFDIDVIIDCSSEAALEKYTLGKKMEAELIQSGFSRIDIRAYNHLQLNNKTAPIEFGINSRLLMLIDSAKLLWGKDIRKQLVSPSMESIRSECIGLIFWFLNHDPIWWKSLQWDDIAAFFSLPARFLYTLRTGKVACKQAALEFYLENYIGLSLPENFSWIIWALSVRYQKNSLFFPENVREFAGFSVRQLFFDTLKIIFCNEFPKKPEEKWLNEYSLKTMRLLNNKNICEPSVFKQDLTWKHHIIQKMALYGLSIIQRESISSSVFLSIPNIADLLQTHIGRLLDEEIEQEQLTTFLTELNNQGYILGVLNIPN